MKEPGPRGAGERHSEARNWANTATSHSPPDTQPAPKTLAPWTPDFCITTIKSHTPCGQVEARPDFGKTPTRASLRFQRSMQRSNVLRLGCLLPHPQAQLPAPPFPGSAHKTVLQRRSANQLCDQHCLSYSKISHEASLKQNN